MQFARSMRSYLSSHLGFGSKVKESRASRRLLARTLRKRAQRRPAATAQAVPAHRGRGRGLVMLGLVMLGYLTVVSVRHLLCGTGGDRVRQEKGGVETAPTKSHDRTAMDAVALARAGQDTENGGGQHLPRPRHVWGNFALLWAKKSETFWAALAAISPWKRASPGPGASASQSGPCDHRGGQKHGSDRKRKRNDEGNKNNYSRRNNDDDDDDDDEDDEDNGMRGRNGRSGGGGGFLWACPFYKFDPHRHHRCVGKYNMKRYVDVKQHVLRCHILKGFYYCTTCWEVWSQESPWRTHTNDRTCAEMPGPEHLTDQEINSFGAANPRRLNDYQKWYSMWHKLFRGHEPPVSPYVEDGIAEPAALLGRGFESALRAHLPALLPRYGINLDPNAVSGLAGDLVGIFAEACRPPPRRYRCHPHLGAGGAGAWAGPGTAGDAPLVLRPQAASNAGDALPAETTRAEMKPPHTPDPLPTQPHPAPGPAAATMQPSPTHAGPSADPGATAYSDLNGVDVINWMDYINYEVSEREESPSDMLLDEQAPFARGTH